MQVLIYHLRISSTSSSEVKVSQIKTIFDQSLIEGSGCSKHNKWSVGAMRFQKIFGLYSGDDMMLYQII